MVPSNIPARSTVATFRYSDGIDAGARGVRPAMPLEQTKDGTDMVMACIVMAYIVMAYVVMAYIAMASVAM